jgi:hypothetical protein
LATAEKERAVVATADPEGMHQIAPTSSCTSEHIPDGRATCLNTKTQDLPEGDPRAAMAEAATTAGDARTTAAVLYTIGGGDPTDP